jgi:hypothetical protein
VHVLAEAQDTPKNPPARPLSGTGVRDQREPFQDSVKSLALESRVGGVEAGGRGQARAGLVGAYRSDSRQHKCAASG